MSFTLQISTSNDAFSAPYFADEVALILRNTADKIQGGYTSGSVQDTNGNTVGSFEVAEDAPEPSDDEDEARVGSVTVDQATSLIVDAPRDDDPNGWRAIRDQLKGHLERGKGIAIYRNEDLGHPGIGHCMAFTYGTPEAQFEGGAGRLPEHLPDGLARNITGGINWRYLLHAVVER